MQAERKPWTKRPDAPQRMTGRRAVDRRKRWLTRHPLCLHCERAGRVRIADEVDHVIPLARGGADDESNFQSLCRLCHQAKTAADEGRRVRPRIGIDGFPIDEATP